MKSTYYTFYHLLAHFSYEHGNQCCQSETYGTFVPSVLGRLTGRSFRDFRDAPKIIFRLLLKYKGVVRLAKAAEKALAMSKNVRRIQEAFMDQNRTNFVAVTIAEAMGLLELERLVSALDNAKIHCGNIIVNMVNTPLSPPSRGVL